MNITSAFNKETSKLQKPLDTLNSAIEALGGRNSAAELAAHHA